MRIKKFVAPTMSEVMSAVRAEFGSDAVILHTRRITRPAWLRFILKPRVEVIAALETSGRNLTGRGNVRVESQGVSAESENIPSHGGSLESILSSTAVRELHRRLVDQDVDERIALSVIRESLGGLTGNLDPVTTRARIKGTICSLIKTTDIWTDGKKRVVALIGPTGVGKTTTIAKLAANYSLLSGKDVGLITIDTYRIAAVEQLKTYADIISVPISVAYTPEELSNALEEHKDKELVLIDTAGRSARNPVHMQELRTFMEAAKPDETHLVISATTRMNDVYDVAKRFAAIGYDRIIVTKLDESTSYGCLLNLAVSTGKPISYLTDGQKVPDDIEAVDALKVSALILGDETGE